MMLPQHGLTSSQENLLHRKDDLSCTDIARLISSSDDEHVLAGGKRFYGEGKILLPGIKDLVHRKDRSPLGGIDGIFSLGNEA